MGRPLILFFKKKSRIRETPNLSTDADSSTNTCFPAAAAKGAANHFVLIVGIPKNTKYKLCNTDYSQNYGKNYSKNYGKNYGQHYGQILVKITVKILVKITFQITF